MSQHDIGVAVPQRTTITRVSEDTMTSPYLDHRRSTRETIEDLIAAREVALVKTTAAAQRWCIDRDLGFLREELARIGDKAAALVADASHPARGELLRDECS
jgi:hypothetical protein